MRAGGSLAAPAGSSAPRKDRPAEAKALLVHRAPKGKLDEDALRAVSQDKAWLAMVEKSGNKPLFRGYVESHRYLMSEWKATAERVAALGLGDAR